MQQFRRTDDDIVVGTSHGRQLTAFNDRGVGAGFRDNLSVRRRGLHKEIKVGRIEKDVCFRRDVSRGRNKRFSNIHSDKVENFKSVSLDLNEVARGFITSAGLTARLPRIRGRSGTR